MSAFKKAQERAEVLLAEAAASGERRLLGLIGPPGSGKSTIAARLAATLGEIATVVPMDGFHLANRELARLGRQGRKGAPDTFDVGGFVSLLRRLSTEMTSTVYAPFFDRDIEEAIAGALPIQPETRLVIVEGNYLLCDGPWSEVAPLLDETWFVQTNTGLRHGWLEARHISFGRTLTAAQEWIAATDDPNALLIDATRDRADWIFENEPLAAS